MGDLSDEFKVPSSQRRTLASFRTRRSRWLLRPLHRLHLWLTTLSPDDASGRQLPDTNLETARHLLKDAHSLVLSCKTGAHTPCSNPVCTRRCRRLYLRECNARPLTKSHLPLLHSELKAHQRPTKSGTLKLSLLSLQG